MQPQPRHVPVEAVAPPTCQRTAWTYVNAAAKGIIPIRLTHGGHWKADPQTDSRDSAGLSWRLEDDERHRMDCRTAAGSSSSDVAELWRFRGRGACAASATSGHPHQAG